jgi:hypothetical protein
MQVEALAYKRHVQTKIFLRPTLYFLLEGELSPKYLEREKSELHNNATINERIIRSEWVTKSCTL